MNFARVTILSLIVLLAPPLLASAQTGQYTLQIQATPTSSVAEERVKHLKAQSMEAYWIKSNVPGKGVLYRVRIGRFPNRAAAKAYGERLRQQGIVQDFYVAEYEAPSAESKVQPSTSVPAKAAADPVKETLKPAVEKSQTSKPTSAVQTQAAVSPAAHVTVAEAPKTAKNTAPSPTSSAAYPRFEDKAAGYSFEYPSYWTGSSLGSEETQAQRIDAGATFKSQQDAAFLNAIWNTLAEANSSAHDNNLIVDLIIKSMGSGAETQSLTETSRRVTTEGNQIKTFSELHALFRDPRAPTPLEFLGKAVIIRASKGILMVVVFYAKESPPNTANVAERIIRSARAPE